MCGKGAGQALGGLAGLRDRAPGEHFGGDFDRLGYLGARLVHVSNLIAWTKSVKGIYLGVTMRNFYSSKNSWPARAQSSRLMA